jgi:hypothetical protein
LQAGWNPGNSAIAQGKAEKILFLGVFPKNFSTYYNVREPDAGSREGKGSQMRPLPLVAYFCCSLLFAAIAMCAADLGPISSSDEGVTLRSSRNMKCCSFGTGTAFQREARKPSEGMKLVGAEIEADFPPGDAWDLSVLALQVATIKERVFPPIGFSIYALPDPMYDDLSVLYKFENGAGGLLIDNQVKLVTNPVNKRGQVWFFTTKDAKGQDVKWPGGKARVTLVFEIPDTASELRLIKMQKIILSASPITRGDVGPRAPPPSPATPPVETTSAKSILPKHDGSLSGTNEVRINNPNSFRVVVGIRSGTAGVDFEVPAESSRSTYLPDGRFDMYFVFSNRPDSLFQGDGIELKDNGVEVKLVKVIGGNYPIHQVK